MASPSHLICHLTAVATAAAAEAAAEAADAAAVLGVRSEMAKAAGVPAAAILSYEVSLRFWVSLVVEVAVSVHPAVGQPRDSAQHKYRG